MKKGTTVMLSINRDELRMALDRMCKVASSSPEDAEAAELKFSASGKSMVVQATSVGATTMARYTFSAGACEIDKDCSFCIPAVPLRDSVALMRGDNIIFSVEQRTVSIRGDDDDAGDEHSLMGMMPDTWKGSPSFIDEIFSFVAKREALVAASKYAGPSCADGVDKAPLTAIRIGVSANGDLSAVASDQGRVSYLNLSGACHDLKSKDGTDDCFFMLLPAPAKTLQAMFGQEHAEISVRVNTSRILFTGGGLSFDIAHEVGVDSFPRLGNYVLDDGFAWSFDVNEVRRAVNMVSIVASQSLARVEFNKSGKMIISGQGVVEKGSKSRQTVTPIETSGEILDPNFVEVACVDLKDALAIPTSPNVRIGLRLTINPAINPVVFIEQDGEVEWKHLIARSVNVG